MAQSTNYRPQPPSIKDPEEGDLELVQLGEEDEDEGVMPEQNDSDVDGGSNKDKQPKWESRAQDAYKFSTSFIDTNYRREWEDSIRAFNSQHPGDSKFNSESMRKRSNIFVPKTRSIIRKNEAAAAAAFFSNLDRVSITPVNGNDANERASAEINEALLQYRLTKSIPWFQVMMGAIQDAQTVGAAIAHIFWRYSMRRDADGKLMRDKDQPQVDLIPIENFRFDPAASWTDPVNTSPYIIHILPMYVVDVRARMDHPDPKGRKWTSHPDSDLLSRDEDDSTRRTRGGNREDSYNLKRDISDYDICYVHRHIHRWRGTDYEFYTLNSRKLLTDPEPLDQTVFHGLRPYVMGVTSIETHKPIPTPLPQMARGLQDEINEIKNSRLDNVKFVLNKGYFVKRGKNVDLPALVRNVPGRLALMDDPATDVVENQWQDVTQSSYLEEDRNNAAFDELVGNFSAASVQTARAPREPARAMTLLQAPAGVLTEYMLKTFAETFVQPTLRQLVLLNQHYETDQVVLEIAGAKSKLWQKLGMDKITDDMIERELAVNVNVGMGATDPVMKLQKFLLGVESFAKISVKPPPGVNLGEVWKEIMALTGYSDGERFSMGQDPEAIRLQQQLKQLTVLVQKLSMDKNNKHEANMVRLLVAKIAAEAKDKQHHHEKVQTVAEHALGIHDREHEHALGLNAKQQEHSLGLEAGDADMGRQMMAAEHQQAITPPEPVSPAAKAKATDATPAAAPVAPAEPNPELQELVHLAKQNAEATKVVQEAIMGLAHMLGAQLKASKSEEPKKPRKRTGKAKLPSGAMMEFEMEEQ